MRPEKPDRWPLPGAQPWGSPRMQPTGGQHFLHQVCLQGLRQLGYLPQTGPCHCLLPCRVGYTHGPPRGTPHLSSNSQSATPSGRRRSHRALTAPSRAGPRNWLGHLGHAGLQQRVLDQLPVGLVVGEQGLQAGEEPALLQVEAAPGGCTDAVVADFGLGPDWETEMDTGDSDAGVPSPTSPVAWLRPFQGP